MAITNTDFQNVALAISAYADEEYTTAKKIKFNRYCWRFF